MYTNKINNCSGLTFQSYTEAIVLLAESSALEIQNCFQTKEKFQFVLSLLPVKSHGAFELYVSLMDLNTDRIKNIFSQ